MEPLADVRARYTAALDSLVAKLKQDRYILAAILFGSLSYDEVWEKSDIDLMLVGRDEKQKSKDFGLVENGVGIHAMLVPRSKFREQLEKSVQGTFFHSMFSRSTLLFSHDDSIRDYYENHQRVGARDREIVYLQSGPIALATLAKAEKWLYVKNDLEYSFLWILYTVTYLAKVEVAMHGEVSGREVIQQALRLNPDFFRAVYTDLIHKPKTRENLQKALDRINAYLDERGRTLFRPILDYLAEEGGVRSYSDLSLYFEKRAQSDVIGLAFEWLASKGIIRLVSVPVRLHEKSVVTMEEAAFYYDGGEQE